MCLIIETEVLDDIFNQYYGDIVTALDLDERQLFVLENPLIPERFSFIRPALDEL
jgi:hypothetical protein